jgi:recombinational DNA repair protein (RecF pathway)
MSKYVTVKCPRCISTIQLQATSIMSDTFLCPVCSEGEIEFNIEPKRIYRYERKIPFEWEDLLTVYSASQ